MKVFICTESYNHSQGVIEGCRTAFSIFCSALFESSSKHLNYIPQKILAEVLHYIVICIFEFY